MAEAESRASKADAYAPVRFDLIRATDAGESLHVHRVFFQSLISTDALIQYPTDLAGMAQEGQVLVHDPNTTTQTITGGVLTISLKTARRFWNR